MPSCLDRNALNQNTKCPVGTRFSCESSKSLLRNTIFDWVVRMFKSDMGRSINEIVIVFLTFSTRCGNELRTAVVSRDVPDKTTGVTCA